MGELLRQSEARLLGSTHAQRAVSTTAWNTLLEKILAALAAEHVRAPDMIGVGRERLRRLALPALEQVLFNDLLTELLAQGRIQQSGAWLHEPQHRVELSANERALWTHVHPLLEQAPFHPPRVRDLASTASVAEDDLRRLLKQVARVGGWFWPLQIGRGILMTLSVLPIVYTLRLSRGQAAIAVGAILWVAGGLAPLIPPNPLMGDTQRIIHIFEILTQNAPLGATVVFLMRPGSAARAVPTMDSVRRSIHA